MKEKTLDTSNANEAKKAIKDLKTWGNGDTFKLISKASSKAEGWMKSTKAMPMAGAGCIVQVTTQQGSNIAEATTHVPSVSIYECVIDGIVTARKLLSNGVSGSIIPCTEEEYNNL